MFSNTKWYREDIEYIASFNIDWEKLQGTSVLVTGATGLIGTVVVDALMYKNSVDKLDLKVFALARDKEKIEKNFGSYRKARFFKAIRGDVAKKLIVKEKVDFIINLASNTHPALYATKPIETINSIVTGTKNVLEFAASNKVKRVINASSVEVYGENRGDTERFKEDYSGYINSNTLRAGYPESKRLAEALCQAYIAEKNLDIVSVRLGRVYGSTTQKSDSKSTSQFIRSAVNKQDIVLKSEGRQEYSYVYVADVVVALLLLLTRGESSESYNIASDEAKDLRGVAEAIANINNSKVVFDIPNETERKGSSVVQRALMDSSKIKALGWRSGYDLVNGLERTVRILEGMNDAKKQ